MEISSAPAKAVSETSENAVTAFTQKVDDILAEDQELWDDLFNGLNSTLTHGLPDLGKYNFVLPPQQ
ncbi:MAG: hypothetical protein OXI96_03590 [Acidimicrobiaceae bacterium]|nr:hypothetical protein [Acidimicrobiaceae bacterium]